MRAAYGLNVTPAPVDTKGPMAKKRVRKTSPAPTRLSIEDAWRYVDRFARALWGKHMESNPPGSLAELITAMRDQDVVPPHEANMMHTIRSLRNLVVHENVVFGKHETAIARAAWQIVRDWAQQHEDEVWHLTMAVCRTAA